MMSITWPFFGDCAVSTTISFPFALLVKHPEHTDAILIFVILRVKLLRCEPVDQTNAELQLLVGDLHVLAFRHLLEIPHLVRVVPSCEAPGLCGMAELIQAALCRD